ncbi:MAG: flippase-like domain-containing protein [Bacteroidetes bacterium]|nr:flippase-like domain-containing protein [Bacteroidota bacterium]
MKKYLSLILQYLIFLGLGIFLIWWSMKSLSPEDMRSLKASLGSANYLLVLPAMCMIFLSHYSRALRWRIMLEPLGYQPSRANTFIAVLLGYFFNLLVPRMGEVVKCTTLAKYEKTPVEKLIGTMLAERALDVVCLLVSFGLAVGTQMDLMDSLLGEQLDKMRGGGAGMGRTVWLAFAGLVLGVSGYFLLRRLRHIAIIEKIWSLANGIWQGLTSIRLIERKPEFFLHTIFIWLMYLLSIRIGLYAMEPVSHLGMGPSLTLLWTGSLAMIATQGGIGAYQIAVQKSLSLYGVLPVAGLAFGWLLWAFQTVLMLVAGILCLIILPILNRDKA